MGIHSSVTVDTALTSRQSVILNQTAVMAQRRGIRHVLNTTGIVLASVIKQCQYLVLNQNDCQPKILGGLGIYDSRIASEIVS